MEMEDVAKTLLPELRSFEDRLEEIPLGALPRDSMVLVGDLRNNLAQLIDRLGRWVGEE